MDELLEKETKLRELEQESKSVCITRAQDKEYVEQGIRDEEDERRDGACPLDIFHLMNPYFLKIVVKQVFRQYRMQLAGP